MSNVLARLRLCLSDLIAEDRRDFQRIDVSPAKYDDGSWLDARR